MFKALVLCLLSVSSAFVLPLKLAGAIKEGPRVITDYGAWIVTPVSVGTPPQNFNLVVDTTVATTWIPDSSCSKCSGTLFNRTASSTFIGSGITDGISDNYGTTYFEVAYDNVMLGTNISNSIIVLNATFGAASVRGAQFEGVSVADGVLGLAFPSVAAPSTYPVLYSGFNQGALTAGVFTIWLEDQWETADNGTHGVLFYGNYDYQHCLLNEKKMYSITTAKQYQITMTSFTSGNYTYNKNAQTTLDSTSYTISVPNVVAAQILNQLGLPPHSQLPVDVPCDSKFDLQFTFRLGTEHVTEKNLVYNKPNGGCYLAIDSTLNTFNLGLPFFRGRCTYFDFQRQQVGFSDAATHD